MSYRAQIEAAACALGLPPPVAEYRFAPPRRWRFDFAWPELLIAVEVEGGVWSRGRHVRGRGYLGDLEKYNAAVVMGWRVLRYTPQTLERLEDDLITLLRRECELVSYDRARAVESD